MKLRAPLRWVRRTRATTRPVRDSALRWLHHVEPGGAVVYGMAGRALDDQRPGAVSLGEDVVVGDDVSFHIGPRGRVEIGRGTVLGGHVTVAADSLVRIGEGCRIGRHVVIADTWTYGRDVPGAPEPEEVRIGDGADLGPNCVVGPGTHIGAGGVVPAGARRHPATGAVT